MKIKNFCLILIVLSLVMLGFGCQGSATKEKENDSFSAEELKPYEALVGAYEKDVIAFLGEGEYQDFPGVIEGVDESYSVMWQCKYEGSPLSDQGYTIVRYFLPTLEEMTSNSKAKIPRKVAYLGMDTTLSIAEAKEILDVLFQDLGNPNPLGKETPFDETQPYDCYWERDDFRYMLTYSPPPTNEKSCSIGFFIEKPDNNP